MIRRRRLLQASAGLLAAPAIVEKVGAQSAFDWKQFKGQHIEVNYSSRRAATSRRRNMKQFEDTDRHLRRLRADPRAAAAPESGDGDVHRPPELRRGAGRHARAEAADRARALDGGPAPVRRRPDADRGRFRHRRFQPRPAWTSPTGADGKLNVLPLNQDLFILFWNKELFAAKGLNGPPKTLDEMMAAGGQAHRPVEGRLRLRRPRPEERQRRALRQHPARLGPGDGDARRQDAADRHAEGDRGGNLVPEDHARVRAAGKWSASTGTNAKRRSARRARRCGGTASASRRRSWTRRPSKVTESVGFAPAPAGPDGHWSPRPSSTASASPRGARTRRRPGCSCNGSCGKHDDGRAICAPAPARRRAPAPISAPTSSSHRVPAGMVRHHARQPEDRALRPAGYRSGDGVPRHHRRRADQHRRRRRPRDGTEEGDGRVPAGAG